MIKLGVTGGVGMGKNATGEFLRQSDIAIIDTDVIAREFVAEGQPALALIAKAFGQDVLTQSGSLNRSALAQIVFTNIAARRKLEAILHPLIRAEWRCRLDRHQASGTKMTVVIIPLLFETGGSADFDATICVACSQKAQQERLKQRGWTEEQIERRLAAQFPIEKKMAAADYVVWSEGPLRILEAQLREIITKLRKR